MAIHNSQLTDLSVMSIDEIANFYSSPRAWVRSNMAISLDGHFVDDEGSSRGLSSSLDVTILLILRALSDVVVVGGATARQEGYAPKLPRSDIAHLCPTPPRLCVVSREMNFSVNDAMFQQDVSMPLIVTSKSDEDEWNDRADALSDVAEIVLLEEVTGSSLLAALKARGLQSIVSEGGPYLQNLLRASNVLDELAVTIAPVIIGTAAGMSAFGEVHDQLELQSIARGGDHTYARFLVAR